MRGVHAIIDLLQWSAWTNSLHRFVFLAVWMVLLVMQVLDLGVTRLLVQWLVEVFPNICKGDMPLAGTEAASRRVCNKRLKHLGRRSKACRTPPG